MVIGTTLLLCLVAGGLAVLAEWLCGRVQAPGWVARWAGLTAFGLVLLTTQVSGAVVIR